MKKTNLILGVLLCFVLAAIAFVVKEILPFLAAEVIAILLGMILGNIVNFSSPINSGIKFTEKKVLSWAVALLGFQMSFQNLNLSIWLVPVLILIVLVSIYSGKIFARKFGVDKNCGFFIGVGTAICGASAIAAVSGLFETKSHHTGVSVGVVNVLGTVGMLLLPLVAVALNLSGTDSGILMGASLQAVGHAVGAGYAVGEEAGQIATLVKLSRVLLLAPVVLLTILALRNKNTALPTRKLVPGFILFFIAFLLLVNIFTLPEQWLLGIKQVDKWLLTAAMAAIGLNIKARDLLTQGPKALLLGTVLFLVQIGLILGFIYGQQLIAN